MTSLTGGPPPLAIVAGIDWAKDTHAICVIDTAGTVLQRYTLAHTANGIAQLVHRLIRAGVSGIGIERGDGPVIDALLAAELTVYVISPNTVKNLRSRHGAAGNKDDRFDAYVLADAVRTDAHRYTPLERSSPATMALRSTVRARGELVKHRVAATNQLTAHLENVAPAVLGLFSDLASPISLSFIESFPTQSAIDSLTPARLRTWLKRHRYSGRTSVDTLLERVHDAARGLTDQQETYAAITLAQVGLLRALNVQIRVLDTSLKDQLAQHLDTLVFASLPRVATIRAATLLAEIGDARGRFPDPQSLACLAGVVPSTRSSGKATVITFRWAANKHLRAAITDFADGSRHANPWAADTYDRARARGHDHQHAIRILSRAWVPIIWRCWNEHVPYNPAQHRAYQTLLATTGQAA